MNELLHLALALASVFAAARCGGVLAVRLSQPPVIGELAFCLALGPMLLGGLDPEATAAIFPASVRAEILDIGRIGIALFMFFIGADFCGELGRDRGRVAKVISAVVTVGVSIPLLLGVAVAILVAPHLLLAPGTHWLSAVFVGIALATTAFPILAAIVEETDIARTRVGDLALACAAGTDILVWTILAIVAADAHGRSSRDAAGRLLVIVALTVTTLLLLRPALGRLLWLPSRARSLGTPMLAIAIAAMTSTVTARLGFTVVFGGFLAGLAFRGLIPRESRVFGGLRRVNRLLLLPVFFAAVGLGASFRGLGRPASVIEAVAILLVAAVVGKVGGVYVAARYTRVHRREALALGILLNTKGLTEIVVLGVGFELQLISSGVLAMLIIVALVTTAATIPLLRGLDLMRARRGQAPPISADLATETLNATL
jgi:Kef-type K+ transport system membrane component KefB